MNKDGVAMPVNLGNPPKFMIMELAEIILRQSQSSSKLIY